MASRCCMVSCAFLLLLIAFPSQIHAEISGKVFEQIRTVNAKGSHYGVVVPGQTVLEPFQQLFKADDEIPTVEISGRTFHVGSISGRRVILVMSGDGMLNAAQTTKLLLNLFRVRSVIHYGKAGSANPKELNVGDLSIPTHFAHCGVWHWAKYGLQGDEIDYDRDIANLKFSGYTDPKIEASNFLDSVYLQRGEPKIGKRMFSFSVDEHLFRSAQKMAESVVLERCYFRTAFCLSEKPKVKAGVGIGCSSDIYVDNVAYRDFVHSSLNASSIDTESAAVAWVCFGEKKPFIAMRSITDLGGSAPNQNDVVAMPRLLPRHILSAMKEYFKQLPGEESERGLKCGELMENA